MTSTSLRAQAEQVWNELQHITHLPDRNTHERLIQVLITFATTIAQQQREASADALSAKCARLVSSEKVRCHDPKASDKAVCKICVLADVVRTAPLVTETP